MLTQRAPTAGTPASPQPRARPADNRTSPRHGSRTQRARRYVALTLMGSGIALLMALAAAFAWQSLPSRDDRASGVLTTVEQRDIGHASVLVLRTFDGRELRFVADEQLNQTPGHLREHMTYGEPVMVHYRRDGTTLIALRVDDLDP